MRLPRFTPVLFATLALGACQAAPAEETAAMPEAMPETTPETTEVTASMDGLLNPNLATVAELEAAGLAGEVAAALIDNRPYLTAGALHDQLAAAVGDEAALAVYETVWVPINLNDVTEAEILRIPGVGDRMAHEFEEYRPYDDMAEFRREIGKYVDDAEVERLAQYVYVPIDLNSASRDEIMMIPGMDDRMAHEFEEYRPYSDLEQFRREIGKYVDEYEVARLERYVGLN